MRGNFPIILFALDHPAFELASVVLFYNTFEFITANGPFSATKCLALAFVSSYKVFKRVILVPCHISYAEYER